MMESAHLENFEGRKVLLKTPSGFALFYVEEFALKVDKNIWMYFANSREARQVLLTLGFVKDDLGSAYDGVAGRDLTKLIQKFCKSGELLFVEDIEFKGFIEKNLGISCIYNGHTITELMWGIKNVLGEFVPEEKENITADYNLPMSKDLIEALQYYLINISTKMVDKSFISTFGYLCYMDMNIQAVSNQLRNSYDKFVRISETIGDDLTYAKVLALALVPEFVNQLDLGKTLSEEMSLKLEQTKQFVAESGTPDFNLHDIRIIMGSLNYLLDAPELRDEILTRVKFMESSRFQYEYSEMLYNLRIASGCDAVQPDASITHFGDHVDFKDLKFMRTLLETPSGFAIFDVLETLIQDPKHIWTCFSDPYDAHNVAFALGFVKVGDKSIAWKHVTDPDNKLRRLILRFCKNKVLFVQSTELKTIIESKLDVECLTDDDVSSELMWGLQFVLSDFILEERDNVIDKNYIQLSKGLRDDFKKYSIDCSSKMIDRDFIYMFAHVVNLDIKLKDMVKALWEKFSHRVREIDRLSRFLQSNPPSSVKTYKDFQHFLKAVQRLSFSDTLSIEDCALLHDLVSRINEVSMQICEALEALHYAQRDSCMEYLSDRYGDHIS